MGIFDVFSKTVDNVWKTKEVFERANFTKSEFGRAESLAQLKRFREAAKIAEEIQNSWSGDVSFSKHLVQQVALGEMLEQVSGKLEQWHQKINEADTLASRAKVLIKTDTGNPLETKPLSEALALFRKSNSLIYDKDFQQSVDKCQQEILKRRKFQTLVAIAEEQAKKLFFKEAVKSYILAKELYQSTNIETALESCQARVCQEDAYEDTLHQTEQASKEGKLRGAIAVLEFAVASFCRKDGIELLLQLKDIVSGRKKFRQGLKAEKLGALKEAEALYKDAKVLLPNGGECQLRLGIVAIKTYEWATAFSYLKDVSGEQAAYLRGFVYAQQGNLQQAYREWQFISQAEIESQRGILKSLSQRQRLLALQNIEQLVKEDLEKAKIASTAFIQNFGYEPVVQDNLEQHIQPLSAAAVWQDKDWLSITNTVERVWIERPDFASLHNYAVATYYYALAQTQFASLHSLIIILSTALTTLSSDPAFKDVPWLGNTPVDFDSVSLHLQRRLEDAIDSFKDKDINKYLQLRDCYRLEVVALRLMGNPLTKGMKVKDVYVTPGCYQRYYTQWQNVWIDEIGSSQEILRSLYTSWGLAVAACLEGDTQRAMQLKPSAKANTESESFAQKFVAYYEGCYQLQHQEWRDAMKCLKQDKTRIRDSIDCQEEVDRLCGIQRGNISEFREHLEFAQLWYELLESLAARSYLAEYKAKQIANKAAEEEISLNQALQELKEVQQIDKNNPVVLDITERVKFSKEISEIHELMKLGYFAEAVCRAKDSNQERIRFIVAETCIKILIGRSEKGEIFSESLWQLGKWAYELCPDEPTFQGIYRLLKLC